MKIALVITRLDKGGSCDVVLTLFERFIADGYDVRLIYGLTRDYPDNFSAISQKYGNKIIYLPALRREINLFWDLIALSKLSKLIKEGKFDLVHTHTSKAGFIGRLAAKICRVKIIVHTPHGHVFYSYFGKFKTAFFIKLEKWAAKFTDRIITLTGLGRDEHVRLGIAEAGKFLPVYCGIDLTRFLSCQIDVEAGRKKWQIAKDDLVVGMVSRLVPIKGVEYFIRAIPEIKKEMPRVKFLIVGDGPLKEGLEKLAENLGVGREIIFTGNRNDIPDFMAIFDVYVLTSLNEGLGRTLIEAMASGKCAVATRVGGVAEIVIDGETGILVEPKDPLGLKKAIVKLLTNKDLRDKMGNKAKERAKALFGVDTMIEKTEKLYQELARLKGIR